MKFACDRCKTRYSIGDERVRGKILKIRCKNCANVITVREGMPEPEGDEPLASAEPRRQRPTTGAPAAQVSAQLASTNRNAAARPPDALEEEWYVSIDGDQSGPFSLTEAQAWIAQRPPTADLHCWSEGFDDWLPVDKVSHFRGLRRKTAPTAPPPVPAAPPRTPKRPTQPQAAAPAATARGAGTGPAVVPREPREPEPKALFAATMASLEKSAEKAEAEKAAAPRANGSAPQAAPAKPMSAGARALAEAFDVGGDGGATQIEGAAFDDHAATTAEPAAPRRSFEPKPVAATAPIAARPAPGLPLPGAKPVPTPGLPLPAAKSSPTQPPLTAKPAVPAPVAAAAPISAPIPTPIGSYDDDEDDGLSIGEVSRVVKLADLAKMGPSNRSASQRTPVGRGTAAATALRGGTGAVARIDPAALGGTSSGGIVLPADPGAPLPEGSEPAAGESAVVAPVVARAHRRGLIMLIGVAALVLAGVIGAVAFFLSRSNDEINTDLGGGYSINNERPEEIVRQRVNAEIGSAATSPLPRPRPRPNPNNVQQQHPGSGGTQIEEPGNSATLHADEVEDMAAKQSTGTQRCYMRAQRGVDGIMTADVKKIAVTLQVDKDGAVTDVQLSDHATDNLGKCLSGQIKRWKFRASSGGTFKIVLAFAAG